MSRTEEILNQLDKCNADYVFPMLDNGYIYPAGAKLTAYRDSLRWVIVIEDIGFNYRGGGHNGICNCLHIFGNCLSYEPGTKDENFLSLTDDASNIPTFDEEEYFFLNPNCTHFTLRNKVLPLYLDRDLYKNSGISLEDETKINAFEFLRLLDLLHHDDLVATEREIRDRIPFDIPKIIELNDWFHPDVAGGELPSQNETFIQLAKVLETGHGEIYRPGNKPNTNWRNWPDGETL